MRSKEYEAYMRSAAWQKKREERLAVDDYKCVMCGRPLAKCKSCQIHHANYSRLGNENVLTDLVSLCGSCHRKIHNYYNRKQA